MTKKYTYPAYFSKQLNAAQTDSLILTIPIPNNQRGYLRRLTLDWWAKDNAGGALYNVNSPGKCEMLFEVFAATTTEIMGALGTLTDTLSWTKSNNSIMLFNPGQYEFDNISGQVALKIQCDVTNSNAGATNFIVQIIADVEIMD